MDKMIGYCGINCEKCEARIATIRDDDKMREEVSRKWCEIFHTDIITPDKINCTGCRGNGVKYFFCSQMCEIKPCVTRKGYESCAECAEMDSCAKLAAEIGNNEKAKENLRRIKAIHHGKSSMRSIPKKHQMQRRPSEQAVIYIHGKTQLNRYNSWIIGYDSGKRNIMDIEK